MTRKDFYLLARALHDQKPADLTGFAAKANNTQTNGEYHAYPLDTHRS